MAENKTLHNNMEENITIIKEISENSSDILINRFTTGNIKCALLFCEGMTSTLSACEMLFAPLMEISEKDSPTELFDYIREHQIGRAHV